MQYFLLLFNKLIERFQLNWKAGYTTFVTTWPVFLCHFKIARNLCAVTYVVINFQKRSAGCIIYKKMLLQFYRIRRKTPVPESLYKKVAGSPILNNICEWLLLNTSSVAKQYISHLINCSTRHKNATKILKIPHVLIWY